MICLDTSEILSSVYSGYKWYFSLKTIFSNPKSYNFFLTPWFFIETIETLKNKIDRSLNNKNDDQIINQLSKNPYIVEFKDQFEVKVEENSLYIKETPWENNELEINFLRSLSDICMKDKGTYLGVKIKNIISQNLFNCASSFNLIKNISDYKGFAKELNKSEGTYLNFRNKLVQMRSYNRKFGDKTNEALIKNASIDTVSFGFLDWIVKNKGLIENNVSLLSRDSLFQNVNNWRQSGDSKVFCHNVQSLYLQWANVNSTCNRLELKRYCYNSIDSLNEISSQIKTIVGKDAVSKRVEAIDRILFWFKKNKILKIVDSDIIRSVNILSEHTNGEISKNKSQKYINSLLNQEHFIDDNINNYAELAEKILLSFKQIESINKEENFLPLFDEVNKWADQLKSTYDEYQCTLSQKKKGSPIKGYVK